MSSYLVFSERLESPVLANAPFVHVRKPTEIPDIFRPSLVMFNMPASNKLVTTHVEAPKEQGGSQCQPSNQVF